MVGLLWGELRSLFGFTFEPARRVTREECRQFAGDSPRYEHDCPDCRFLGRCSQYDLYFCGRGGGCLVSRSGPDDTCHPENVEVEPVKLFRKCRHSQYPDLAEAYSRARALGLV